MDLTILGCWAPYPRAGGACSGYLIREGGVSILLEAGSGSLSKLMNHMDFRSLDAVIVTHLHHDHYLDLFLLRHAVEGARRDGSRDKPLELYIPSEPAEDFEVLAGYSKAFDVISIETLPWEKSQGIARAHGMVFGDLRFRFIPAPHSLPAYSVAIHGERKLVFSGDTAWNKELITLAAGADLLLCEASGLDRDADYLKESHLTARQAGELAREAGARKLMITHFWPEYEPMELAKLADEVFKGQVAIAREGETYKIQG